MKKFHCPKVPWNLNNALYKPVIAQKGQKVPRSMKYFLPEKKNKVWARMLLYRGI